MCLPYARALVLVFRPKALGHWPRITQDAVPSPCCRSLNCFLEPSTRCHMGSISANSRYTHTLTNSHAATHTHVLLAAVAASLPRPLRRADRPRSQRQYILVIANSTSHLQKCTTSVATEATTPTHQSCAQPYHGSNDVSSSLRCVFPTHEPQRWCFAQRQFPDAGHSTVSLNPRPALAYEHA